MTAYLPSLSCICKCLAWLVPDRRSPLIWPTHVQLSMLACSIVLGCSSWFDSHENPAYSCCNRESLQQPAEILSECKTPLGVVACRQELVDKAMHAAERILAVENSELAKSLELHVNEALSQQ